MQGGFMPVAKDNLVPDCFGGIKCNDCDGYGTTLDYDDNHNLISVVCKSCEGYGHFRKETDIIPTVNGWTLSFEGLIQDPSGRYVHRTCGGGLTFYVTLSREHRWSCASCGKSGEMSLPHWVFVQETCPTTFNTLADARGAEQLLLLRETLRATQ